ncbi:uncharacterized protein LOC142503782 isoform X2 [Ascaphus truei]|uniref:uncharacterized protein LOC142503782 isoform X2 n=1 Tax=Ascaphus truei TaxID=8439 RepID=UPI003F5A92F7
MVKKRTQTQGASGGGGDAGGGDDLNLVRSPIRAASKAAYNLPTDPGESIADTSRSSKVQDGSWRSVPEDLSDTVNEPAKNSDLYTTSDRQLPNIGRRIIGGHRDKKGESFNQQVLVEDNNEVKKDDDDDEDYDDEDYDDEERCKEILPKINCKPHSQKGFGALDIDHQKLQASVREKIHCETEPRHFSDVPEDLGDTDNEPAKNSDLYTTSDRQLPNIGRRIIGGHGEKKGGSFNQQVLVDDDDDYDDDDEDYDEMRCKEILPKINCKPHSQKGFGALDTDNRKLQASVREKIHCQTEPRHISDEEKPNPKIQRLPYSSLTPQTLTSSSDSKQDDSSKMLMVFALIVCVVAAAFALLVLKPQHMSRGLYKRPILKDFHNRLGKLQSLYPSQDENLWKMSQSILEKHLNNSESNQQPAILLLAAARDGEHTLQCLSNQLAEVYSSSLNASYMVVTQNSDISKLGIDKSLISGFQSTDRAAVLHRLELLPTGSLLILYKYCDHENAAFKEVALVLTVLLEDPTLAPKLSLKELKENVGDFLQVKFTGPNRSSAHNEMDVDKWSGVWSRISHVVLPVLPETRNSMGDCGEEKQGA